MSGFSAMVSTLTSFLGSLGIPKGGSPDSATFPSTVIPKPREARPEPAIAPVEPSQPSPRESLYTTSIGCVGRYVTRLDEAAEDVACVSSLQAVVFKATGTYIGKGAAQSNTIALRTALDADPRFQKIVFEEIQPGDVVVAVTGEGMDRYQQGRCWIVGKTRWMSNAGSETLWEANDTWAAVLQSYEERDGFPLHCYRLTTTEGTFSATTTAELP